MKIMILNGNHKAANSQFDQYLEKLSKTLEEQGHQIRNFKLVELQINNCIGCYSCWLKTPGICVFKDSMPEILKAFINSDLVLYTSPIVMGFVTSNLKKIQERLLPLGLPYIYMEGDRMQHVRRYKNNPVTALLLDDSSDNNSANLDIIKNIYENSKTRKLLFIKTMDNSIEEVANEINGI